MNYNLSTVRRDPQNELVASKYSAIGDTKKLGSSGGSMYMASSSVSVNALSTTVSPTKVKNYPKEPLSVHKPK